MIKYPKNFNYLLLLISELDAPQTHESYFYTYYTYSTVERGQHLKMNFTNVRAY